ncbi:bifunctional 3-(3-hydroxy-phenyl)propionate/3-hydroxycinnamic acid hydroxylase [Mycobacterium sp. NPDC051198]
MTLPPVPVVIVGAGPTGITAATLLADYGITCLVLDRWDSVYPQPRAVHLDDEINRLIARLGVAGEFAAISRPALGLRLLDNDLHVLAEFRRNTADSVHGFPQANMFDQPELEALLRANAQQRAGVQLRGSSEVTDVTQLDSGSVRVSFTDRGTGEVHNVEATYVLGCDGANSVVRTSIGAAMHDLRFEQRWLVVDVLTEAELDQWDGVHQVCDPVRAATFMRIGADRYRWEFRLLPGEAAEDYSTLMALRGLIAPWVNGVAADALELVRVTEYTFRAQIANRWRRENVFLLGDAAHLTPPFIGQGMGAGLRDAMNLAWKLAGVLNGDLAPSVLDSYEQERKPHARTMIGLALGMGRAMTAGGRMGNILRRIIAPRLHHVPGLHDKLVNGTTPAFRRSALVIKGRNRRQLAGTLCPNPIVAGGGRLDAVLGNHFALITTTEPLAVRRAQLEARGVVIHIAESDSDLAHWLRRGRASAAVLRPDRTVMCAGRDVELLSAAIPAYIPRLPTERSER